MAGTSMKDIRLRIRSVSNTQQITKAMQLVASSKLRAARIRMENSRPYLEIAQDAVRDIAAHNTGVKSPYLFGRKVEKRCLIVVAGDRGLAGSYNANVFRMFREIENEVPYCVLPVGRRTQEYFVKRGAEVLPNAPERAEGLELAACREIAVDLIARFDAGEFDEIVMIYTSFTSVLTQRAEKKRLLPAAAEEPDAHARQMIFEPNPEELLSVVLPDYIAGLLYAAVCDSVASEQAARRVAMDSATKNAEKMIEDLNLRYNRARQASITQEITEIVAGSESESEEN